MRKKEKNQPFENKRRQKKKYHNERTSNHRIRRRQNIHDIFFLFAIRWNNPCFVFIGRFDRGLISWKIIVLKISFICQFLFSFRIVCPQFWEVHSFGIRSYLWCIINCRGLMTFLTEDNVFTHIYQHVFEVIQPSQCKCFDNHFVVLVRLWCKMQCTKNKTWKFIFCENTLCNEVDLSRSVEFIYFSGTSKNLCHSWESTAVTREQMPNKFTQLWIFIIFRFSNEIFFFFENSIFNFQFS